MFIANPRVYRYSLQPSLRFSGQKHEAYPTCTLCWPHTKPKMSKDIWKLGIFQVGLWATLGWKCCMQFLVVQENRPMEMFRPDVLWNMLYVRINSLSCGRCGSDFGNMIFKLIIQNSTLNNRCEIALRWMLKNINNEMSELVQVMAWCYQAPSHYLSQCWLRFLSPYCITRPQWIKSHHVI